MTRKQLEGPLGTVAGIWVILTLLLLLSMTGCAARKSGVSCCGDKVCATQGHHTALNKQAPRKEKLLLGVEPAPVYDEERMARYFKEYNVKYFDGKLPSTQVVWGHLQSVDLMAQTFPTGETFLIVLVSRYHPSGNEARVTLLHEMVHVKLMSLHVHSGLDETGHGPRFDEEIRALAAKGAFDGIL